jgi:hypothetical protein
MFNWFPNGPGGFLLACILNASTPESNCKLVYTPDRKTWIQAAPLANSYGSAPRLQYQQNRLWFTSPNHCRYSDDFGQHWDSLLLPNPALGAPYPGFGWAASGDTVVFADYDNIWHRTVDFGQNWSILTTPSVVATDYIAFIFRQKRKLLFCTNGGQIWTSADWGDSWVQTCSGLPNLTSDDLMIYRMIHDSVLITRNFMTLDAGKHWLEMTGASVPLDPYALAWNAQWLYFSGYQRGIYRVPSGPILAKLAQLDGLSPTNEISLSTWDIRPNPVRNRIYFAGSLPAFTNWQILDLSGRVVAEGRFQEPGIPVQTLHDGVYFLKMETEKGMEMRKFVVQNE